MIAPIVRMKPALVVAIQPTRTQEAIDQRPRRPGPLALPLDNRSIKPGQVACCLRVTTRVGRKPPQQVQVTESSRHASTNGRG